MRSLSKLWKCVQLLVISAGLSILVGMTSPLVFAQSEPSEPPAGSAVTRLLPDQLTVLPDVIEETAPIYLDGRALFHVSAPVVEGQNPAEIRAQEIQQRLNEIAREQLTTPTQVTITTDNPSELPEIVVGTQRLLTVTNLDAQISGHGSTSDRALYLTEKLNDAFERHRLERQPSFLWQQAKIAVGILIASSLFFWLLKRVDKRLKARQVRLTNTSTQLGQATSLGKPPMSTSPGAHQFETVFELLKARLDNRQKRKLNETAIALVTMLETGLWITGLLWILSLFPYSRWIPTLLLHWAHLPAFILLIAGVAYAAVRVSSLTIDKIGLTLQESAQWGVQWGAQWSDQWAPEKSQRLSLRFSTFSQVAKGIVGVAIFSLMVLAMLAVSGVQVGPLLAGAGIAGLGVSLAAQELIKDIINGFLILFEDQFGIGDIITVDGMTGSVESVNLRITQLRNTEGCLITIPNNQIGIVQNHSKDWSQVDLSITVSPATDITEALTLLQRIATTLSEEPEWRRSILEPPDLLGVESIDHRGIALRLLLKTQRLRQWPVARELRKRIKHAFEQSEIAIGVPQEKLELHWEDSQTLTQPEDATQSPAQSPT